MNSIIHQKYGIMPTGQSISTVSNTHADYKNVKRMQNYLSSILDNYLDNYLFEENTERTRMRVKDAVSNYLNSLRVKQTINNFKVICDDTNNSTLTVDNNELWIDVFIEPQVYWYDEYEDYDYETFI